MTKEERQKRSKELKAQRKAKALQRKKAKEEKDQKAWLKREEHKAVLKRAKELLSQTEPASTAVREEDTPPIPEVHPEPSTSGQGADPLETSLVESGPLLVSLNPFPSEEEDEDEPPDVPHFRRSTVQMETVFQTTTDAYIQIPAEDAPATTSKAKAAKKVPKKVPSKSRPRPRTGTLNYTPSEKDLRTIRTILMTDDDFETADPMKIDQALQQIVQGLHQAADGYETLRDMLPTVPVTDVVRIVQIAPTPYLQPMSKATIQALQTLGKEHLINQACLVEFEKGISQVALMRKYSIGRDRLYKAIHGKIHPGGTQYQTHKKESSVKVEVKSEPSLDVPTPKPRGKGRGETSKKK